MKRLVAVAALALALTTASVASAAPPEAVTGHSVAHAAVGAPARPADSSVGVIVRFKDPATAPLAAQLLSQVTSSTAAPADRARGIYAFRTPGTALNAELYSAQLMVDAPGIDYAEPNYVRHVMAYTPPTDPDYLDTATWTDGTGYYLNGKHWWQDAMNAPGAWALGQGNTYPVRASASDIKVAVLDVGMYLSHQEFNGGTLVAGKDEFASYNPSTGVFTTDSDVTPDANSDLDFASHGTGTSASAGAEVNGLGMVGTGWNPQVVGYKVAGPITSSWGGYPAGTVLILDASVANGIYDAVNSGCKVINMSLGGSSFSQTYQDAITYAHSHGVVVCASAGNDGNSTVNYPAACTYCTGIAAVARSGGNSTTNGTITRASFSDYGAGVNDLSAPGELFWTADKPDYTASGGGSVAGYQFWAGTSFSSPAVAGAIAYLWRAMPDLTNDQIVNYVESSAVDLGASGRDDNYGYGLVNMQAAYNKMISDYPMLAKPTIAATYVKPSASVTWTPSAGYNVSYQVSVDGTLRSTQAGTAYALPGLSDGQHLISVLPTSSRNWNTSSLSTKTITVDSIAPVPSGFSLVTSNTISWSVAETNPYAVQAYVDSGSPAWVAGNTFDITGLPGGSHTLYVNATDAAGNSSGWVPWAFTTGDVAPNPPVVPSNVVTDALSAVVSWPSVGGAASYDYTINGGSTLSTSGPGFVLTGLTGGSVTQVAVRSVAGTLTSVWATATVTDNIVVPATPVISAPANVATPSVTATWPVASYARSYEYRLNGGTSATTTANTATLTGLALGANSVSVRSLNNFSQSAWATATVTYAVQAPVVPSVVVTDALSANVTWVPVAGAASYDYTINGGSVTSTSGPGFAVTGLTGGVIPVQVRTVRSNGDTSTWTPATVTDNIVVPGTPVISAPTTVGVPSVTATWPAAASARSYEYRLNGGSSTPTTATTATLSGLSLGANAVSVRSLDNLAQSAWATVTVNFAVQAPAISVPATVWASTATVSWTAVPSATGYQYAVNGGSVSATTATSFLATGLAYGANSVTVRTVQGANSSSWSTATVTYSLPSPTTLTLSPSTATVQNPATSTTLYGLIGAPAETFRLQSSPDGSAWSDTGMSRTSTATPAPMPFTVGVSANTYYRLVFNGDNRWTPITSNVATVTYVPTVQPPSVPSFTVTDTLSATVTWPTIVGAASYDYTVNGGSVQSTLGAAFVASGLSVGPNAVAVRTVDGAANRSVWSSATVTVALLVPAAPAILMPATVGVPSVAASWAPASGALSYEYRLDGGSTVPTTATGVTVGFSATGTHVLEVRALDNLSQGTWATATVDYEVPTPALIAPVTVNVANATVSWPAVAGATGYEYRIDGGPVIDTTATSVVATNLASGTHVVEVRVLQGANVSGWTQVTIDYTPPGSPAMSLTTTTPRVGYPATTVTLMGSLGAPGQNAKLQSSLDGGLTWSDTGRSLLSAGSSPVAFVVAISRSTSYRLVFAGNSTWLAGMSPVLSVAYVPHFNIPSVPKSVRHSTRFSATLTLSAPTANLASTVTFQFSRWQKLRGRFQWVVRKLVRVKGKVSGGNQMSFKASTSLPSTGKWRVIGAYVGAPLYGSATTSVRTFRVN